MITLIVDRLKSSAALLRAVSMAEDLNAVFAGTQPESGSVFVVPFRERAKPNALMSGGFRQTVTVQFLVVIVLRRHDDPRGTMRAEAFDTYTNAIEQALGGWRPASESDPCELVGGEATPLKNGVTVYVQTWETTRFLKGA